MYRKALMVFVLLLIWSATDWAQAKEPGAKPTPDPKILKAHSHTLVEASLTELPQLQRLDNRIFVQSWIADLLWPQDAARARALFIEVIGQCLTLAQQADPARSDDHRVTQSLATVFSQILNTLVKRDSRLALDFLRQIREVTPPSIKQTFGPRREWEINLAVQMAATEPQLALQVAKESLEDGINHNLVSLWQGLHGKDPAAAAELFGACWSRVKTLEDSPQQQRMNFAGNFIQALRSALTNGNQNKNEEEQRHYDLVLRQFREALEWFIAESLKLKTSDFLDERNYEKHSQLQHLEGWVEDIGKHLPQRLAVVRAKLNELEGLSSQARYQKWQKKLDNNRPEEIITLAKQTASEERDFLVSNALYRAIHNGDNEAQTRKLIQENIKDPNQQQQMLRQLSRQASLKAFAAGQDNEARAKLSEINNPFERAQVLWEWTMQKYSAGDLKTAQALLEELGALVGERFDTFTQTDWQLHRATLYAELEPARALQLCEAAVDRLNVVNRARIIVREYEQGGLNAAESELPIWEAVNQIPHNLISTLVKLTEKNFAGVRAVAAHWQASEWRLHTQLTLARELQQSVGSETQTIMPTITPVWRSLKR